MVHIELSIFEEDGRKSCSAFGNKQIQFESIKIKNEYLYDKELEYITLKKVNIVHFTFRSPFQLIDLIRSTCNIFQNSRLKCLGVR